MGGISWNATWEQNLFAIYTRVGWKSEGTFVSINLYLSALVPIHCIVYSDDWLQLLLLNCFCYQQRRRDGCTPCWAFGRICNSMTCTNHSSELPAPLQTKKLGMGEGQSQQLTSDLLWFARFIELGMSRFCWLVLFLFYFIISAKVGGREESSQSVSDLTEGR